MVLSQVIGPLIKAAEQAIRGHKQGSLRKQFVMIASAAGQQFLAQNGLLPAAVPDIEVSAEIDRQHAIMKETGELTSEAYGKLVLDTPALIELIKVLRGGA